jgi:hypothetical protein
MGTAMQPPKSQLELILDELFENLTKHKEFDSTTIIGLKTLAKRGYLSNVSKLEQVIKAQKGARSEAN